MYNNLSGSYLRSWFNRIISSIANIGLSYHLPWNISFKWYIPKVQVKRLFNIQLVCQQHIYEVGLIVLSAPLYYARIFKSSSWKRIITLVGGIHLSYLSLRSQSSNKKNWFIWRAHHLNSDTRHIQTSLSSTPRPVYSCTECNIFLKGRTLGGGTRTCSTIFIHECFLKGGGGGKYHPLVYPTYTKSPTFDLWKSSGWSTLT